MNIFFIAQKQAYLKALLGIIILVFAIISTVGMFGSTEMQAAHHQQSFSIGSSLAGSLNSNQTDHLEDIVAWDDFGSASSFAVLVILLLVAVFSILPQFKLFTSDGAQFLSRLYTKPPAFSFALQEAFSRGIINGKAY